MKYSDYLISIDDEYFYATFFGIALVVILGLMPLIGPIVGGFVVGTIMSSPIKGLKIGAIVGLIGSFLVNFGFISLFASVSISLTPINYYGFLVSSIFENIRNLSPYHLIVIGVLFASIGGIVGGYFAEKASKTSYERGKEIEKATKLANRFKE